MSLNASYQDLNLTEGASLKEIKAAFRKMAKTYHPDAAGCDQGDVEKFIKAQNAYQNLMRRAMSHNRAQRAQSAAAFDSSSSAPAVNWRFLSRRELGLDVYYSILVLRPSLDGLSLVMPWKSRQACPRCLGQGRTLGRVSHNSIYRPCSCFKCGGSGQVETETQIKINIAPEMVGRDKIRLRRAGLYSAKNAQRGDLILDITWVDELPAHN